MPRRRARGTLEERLGMRRPRRTGVSEDDGSRGIDDKPSAYGGALRFLDAKNVRCRLVDLGVRGSPRSRIQESPRGIFDFFFLSLNYILTRLVHSNTRVPIAEISDDIVDT